MKTSRITIGLKSKKQAPWFMVIKEFYEDGEIIFAKVLFEIWPTKKLWIKNLERKYKVNT